MNTFLKKALPKAIGSSINVLAIFSPKTAAKQAFKVFSKPRRGKIGPHHEEFLNPNLEPKISVEEHHIQPYKWPGTGKTILLVHGWESHSHRWKEMIIRLQQENYNIIAFDAPAHGYSSGKYFYVPLYHQALNKMLETYHPDYLIGHSMGGMTVLYNQSQEQGIKTNKLVILGAPDTLESILSDYQKILGLSNRALAALDRYFQHTFNFKTVEFSSSAFAKKIKVPTLIIHDKEDTITPFSGSQAIHEALEESEFVETEGLNHSLYDIQVNEKIVKFLDQ